MSKSDDLISRSMAIDAIQKAYADTEGGEDKNAVWKNVGLTNALHIMQDLPSAQPEERTEERTETHSCDLISRLSEIRNQYNCFNESEEPYYRALSEVIKMLSEQADGDTISRQDAIRIVDGIDMWQAGWRGDAIESMKALPSAQPQRTGYWIPMTCRYVPGAEGFPYLIKKWTEATKTDDISGLKCSECGEIFDFEEARKWCCECGARMVTCDRKGCGMKKRITIVLEVETEDPVMMTDDFIKNDLECEINCASNAYKIITIETTELT